VGTFSYFSHCRCAEVHEQWKPLTAVWCENSAEKPTRYLTFYSVRCQFFYRDWVPAGENNGFGPQKSQAALRTMITSSKNTIPQPHTVAGNPPRLCLCFCPYAKRAEKNQTKKNRSGRGFFSKRKPTTRCLGPTISGDHVLPAACWATVSGGCGTRGTSRINRPLEVTASGRKALGKNLFSKTYFLNLTVKTFFFYKNGVKKPNFFKKKLFLYFSFFLNRFGSNPGVLGFLSLPAVT